MSWGKTRKVLRSFVCEALRARVDFHVTTYRSNDAGHGRAWVTLDGVEVASLNDCDICSEHTHATRASREPDTASIPTRLDFFDAVGAYLREPIETSLASNDPWVLTLAVMDRRVGQRRLKALADRDLPEPAATLLRNRIQPAASDS